MKYILRLAFVIIHLQAEPSFSWTNLTELVEEAEKADETDIPFLGTRCKTKEEAVEELCRINPTAKPSVIYSFYRDKALGLILSSTEFYGEEVGCLPNWSSLAAEILGTDDIHKCLAGFVALGEIRGLPTFQTTLTQLISGVTVEEEGNLGDIDELIRRFSALRISTET